MAVHFRKDTVCHSFCTIHSLILKLPEGLGIATYFCYCSFDATVTAESFNKERTMINLAKMENDWDHLYTQFKNQTGDSVVCMMHRQTKKFVYLDLQSNRVLSKQEALNYRVDATGIHKILP